MWIKDFNVDKRSRHLSRNMRNIRKDTEQNLSVKLGLPCWKENEEKRETVFHCMQTLLLFGKEESTLWTKFIEPDHKQDESNYKENLQRNFFVGIMLNGQTKCWSVIWDNLVFTSIYHNFLGRSPLVIHQCSLLDHAVYSLTKMQYIHFSCEASLHHPPEHCQSSTADAKSRMKI